MRDRSVNAFSIGDGHIYITEGAVLSAASEAEIAAVLAHEMGHQLAGHLCQPQTRRQNRNYSGGFFDWLFARDSEAVEEQPLGSLTQVIDIAKEQQADQYAINLLRAAGYDPHAMLTVAKRLAQQHGAAHLQDSRRLQALARLLPGVASPAANDSTEFNQIKDRLKLNN